MQKKISTEKKHNHRVQTNHSAWSFRDFGARYGMLFILLLLAGIYSIMMPDLFFTFANLRAILSTQSVLAILAIAIVVPLAVNEFDLSVAANLGFTGLIVTGLMSRNDLDPTMAIIITLAIGVLIGLINGTLVAIVGISSFITTLGMLTLMSGLMSAYAGGMIIEGIPDSFLVIGRAEILGLPIHVYDLIIVVIVFWYLLEQTPLGRYMYAIGGNKEAARLAGVNVRRLIIVAFMISGLLSAIAGIVTSARLGSGDPARGGAAYLMPALTAAFLGAAAIRPGAYNVLGTVIAIFLISVGVTGLQLMGAPYWIDQIFNGAALILAAALTRYLRREAF